MEFLVAFLLTAFFSWITLLIVLPIAQKLADFGLPDLPNLLWQVAVVVLIVNGVEAALTPVHGTVAWLASAVVFWTLMVKWFHVDFFGAVIIVVVQFVLYYFLVAFIVSLLI